MAVDFHGGRLKEQHVAAVFQGGHVGVERAPGVADQDHAARGGKLPRDVAAHQSGRLAQPAQRFGRFRLAQGLEQADAVAVGVQAVDVVEDDGQMPVSVPSEVSVISTKSL